NYLQGETAEKKDSLPVTDTVTQQLAVTEQDTQDTAVSEADSGSLASLLSGESETPVEGGEGDLATSERSKDLFSIMMPMVDQNTGQFQDATIIGAVPKRQ